MLLAEDQIPADRTGAPITAMPRALGVSLPSSPAHPRARATRARAPARKAKPCAFRPIGNTEERKGPLSAEAARRLSGAAGFASWAQARVGLKKPRASDSIALVPARAWGEPPADCCRPSGTAKGRAGARPQGGNDSIR